MSREEQWRIMGYLVNEVESHGSLTDPHFFGLPVLSVLSSDAVHDLLQPPGCLVLLPILLTLRRQNHTAFSTLTLRLGCMRGS